MSHSQETTLLNLISLSVLRNYKFVRDSVVYVDIANLKKHKEIIVLRSRNPSVQSGALQVNLISIGV